ncbi:MAG TPA: hypothetical protein VMT18_07120 [Planctomycetota bacterium]|nr:hypothetical protein [Planctomycetota bacterium]
MLSVDSDLWVAVLELAATHGWQPSGTEPSSRADAGREPLQYAEPSSQRIARDDAHRLAQGARRGLASVPEDELPLGGQPFGGARTLDLIRRAASGELGPDVNARAAIEVLSGPPRPDAVALLEFLEQGGFTLERAP